MRTPTLSKASALALASSSLNKTASSSAKRSLCRTSSLIPLALLLPLSLFELRTLMTRT